MATTTVITCDSCGDPVKYPRWAVEFHRVNTDNEKRFLGGTLDVCQTCFEKLFFGKFPHGRINHESPQRPW